MALNFKITFLILFLNITHAKSQTQLLALKEKILSADSVILVSHKPPRYLKGKMAQTSNMLIINGKINRRNVKEIRVIKDSGLVSLATIVSKTFADSVIETGKCLFKPRHIIYIVKGKNISFIDVCFECRDVETSDDITIPEEDFDAFTWEKLEQYFKDQGFLYGFPQRK